MPTAILFDLDGTLANTDPLHYQTWQKILRDYGLEIDRAFYQARISGRLNPLIVQDLLPQLSIEAGGQLADSLVSPLPMTPIFSRQQVQQWLFLISKNRSCGNF